MLLFSVWLIVKLTNGLVQSLYITLHLLNFYVKFENMGVHNYIYLMVSLLLGFENRF
jgi:hypothetical protein